MCSVNQDEINFCNNEIGDKYGKIDTKSKNPNDLLLKFSNSNTGCAIINLESLTDKEMVNPGIIEPNSTLSVRILNNTKNMKKEQAIEICKVVLDQGKIETLNAMFTPYIKPDSSSLPENNNSTIILMINEKPFIITSFDIKDILCLLVTAKKSVIFYGDPGINIKIRLGNLFITPFLI
jgi:hypothetical protein